MIIFIFFFNKIKQE